MTVFANGLEVACKAQSNQVIAAFPYVCMTPPQTPATPPGLPVPYPTFGMDGDTDKGTGTVKIGGETVTQKNLSYYTKCTGDEAGCAPMKNVVSHVNTGKEYAHAWSGNVKMDGEPVSRFSDLSTNDHASPQAGGAPNAKVGALSLPSPLLPPCADGQHVETVVYPDVPRRERRTERRIAEARKRAVTLDDHHEVDAAAKNWVNGDLGEYDGHRISRKKAPGEGEHDQKIHAVCTICGKSREIDHTMKDGSVVEAKNQTSGFKLSQKLNNQKHASDTGGMAAYKVPADVNRAAARDLETRFGFAVIPV